MIIDRTKSGSRFPIIIHFLFWHNSNTALYEILIAVELFCAWRPRHSIWLFVKSVNAESELVLVYNHWYILRFHLHQEKGINWCPNFLPYLQGKFSSLTDVCNPEELNRIEKRRSFCQKLKTWRGRIMQRYIAGFSLTQYWVDVTWAPSLNFPGKFSWPIFVQENIIYSLCQYSVGWRAGIPSPLEIPLNSCLHIDHYLEKPTLQVAIFPFAAYTKIREQCRQRIWMLR